MGDERESMGRISNGFLGAPREGGKEESEAWRVRFAGLMDRAPREGG